MKKSTRDCIKGSLFILGFCLGMTVIVMVFSMIIVAAIAGLVSIF